MIFLSRVKTALSTLLAPSLLFAQNPFQTFHLLSPQCRAHGTTRSTLDTHTPRLRLPFSLHPVPYETVSRLDHPTGPSAFHMNLQSSLLRSSISRTLSFLNRSTSLRTKRFSFLPLLGGALFELGLAQLSLRGEPVLVNKLGCGFQFRNELRWHALMDGRTTTMVLQDHWFKPCGPVGRAGPWVQHGPTWSTSFSLKMTNF